MKNKFEAPIIRAEGISKQYPAKTVFSDLSLSIDRGGLTLITGLSGSGKTTLLNTVSSVDMPDSGSITVDGVDITTLKSKGREEYRARTGQVFQRSGLLSGLTVMENIKLVHELSGHKIDTEWTAHLLGRLGISALSNELTTHLSGGQAQRVAVVRALAHSPEIVFADEPTASLDVQSKKDVHETLRHVADTGTTVVMVSHEDMSKDYADRILEMKDGVIEENL